MNKKIILIVIIFILAIIGTFYVMTSNSVLVDKYKLVDVESTASILKKSFNKSISKDENLKSKTLEDVKILNLDIDYMNGKLSYLDFDLIFSVESAVYEKLYEVTTDGKMVFEEAVKRPDDKDVNERYINLSIPFDTLKEFLKELDQYKVSTLIENEEEKATYRYHGVKRFRHVEDIKSAYVITEKGLKYYSDLSEKELCDTEFYAFSFSKGAEYIYIYKVK